MTIISFSRIWTIATNGFREVIRDRIFYVIGLFAILLVLAFPLLREVAASTEDKIFIDLGLAAIGILGVLVAIFVGTGLINKEIEKRTVLVLIPKPISRAELIIGKHLGLLGVIAILVIAMSSIYFILLSLNGITYPFTSLVIAQLYQFLELSLIVAAALMFGVFTSSILATLLTVAVYLMGHLSRDVLALGKLSENATIETITQGFYLVLPDLSRLNLKNEVVYGLLPSTATLIGHATYAILYMIMLLLIAILIFSQREF